MDSEYRFDYEKAKPNRFAEKMNLNVGWTVEKFVEEQKEPSRKAQGTSGKRKDVNAKKPAKASPNGKVNKAASKTSSRKGKSAPKKSAAKPKPTAKKKKK